MVKARRNTELVYTSFLIDGGMLVIDDRLESCFQKFLRSLFSFSLASGDRLSGSSQIARIIEERDNSAANRHGKKYG